MKPLRALVLGVIGVALLAGASRVPAASVPRIPVAIEKAAPLLGIVTREKVSVLSRLDPRSLRPRRGARLVLGEGVTTWAFSGDRSALVVAREDTRRGLAVLRFVDPARLAPAGRVVLGPGWAQKATWVAPARVLVLVVNHRTSELVTVDPGAQRVVARQAIPGDVVAVERAPGALVLLLAPEGRIGAATLAVGGADGQLRVAPLSRILAGFESLPDPPPEGSVPHHRIPGLAVDPVGRRAIVVGEDEPAAEVSLDSLAVAYHPLGRPASLLSRLGHWLEPSAQAKAMDGPTRSATWLGRGLVAVSGTDERTYADGSRLQFRSTPSGLQLLGTNSWSLRTLASGADSVARAGAGLLATGTSWDSGTAKERSIGLVAFASDGAVRFRALKGQRVFVELVYRGRAYVRAAREGHVAVDVRSGKLAGWPPLTDLPWVLLGDGG